jgi:hypothetical protein
MSAENRRRASLLAAMIGASVTAQANAGFIQSWKRSALYRSVTTDSDLFDFLSLMGQANSDATDEKMQLFYKAVQAYNDDPGHVDNLPKIQECLNLAVEALAVGNVSVAAVTRIRENVTGTSAASETAQAKPSVPDSETTEDLPHRHSVPPFTTFIPAPY